MGISWANIICWNDQSFSTLLQLFLLKLKWPFTWFSCVLLVWHSLSDFHIAFFLLTFSFDVRWLGPTHTYIFKVFLSCPCLSSANKLWESVCFFSSKNTSKDSKPCWDFDWGYFKLETNLEGTDILRHLTMSSFRMWQQSGCSICCHPGIPHQGWLGWLAG